MPGPRERAISWIVLGCLGAICAGVLLRQARFNPAVTVAATAAAQAGALVDAGETPATSDLLNLWPEGLRPMSGAESFDAGTLSDKINGKAELYLSAGFTAMRSQRVVVAAAPESWIEAFVFDMGRPPNAFSVFSSQRRPGAPDAGLADYSYLADNQLCFVHGRYYVELVATDAHPETMARARDLAGSLIAAHRVVERADVSREHALFPLEGQIPGSITLLSADVFGFIDLKNVYVAKYAEGGDTATLFVARRESSEEAGMMASAFRDFLVEQCGGVEQPPAVGVGGSIMVDLEGSFDCIFSSGVLFAGVHQAPSRESAERLAGLLARHLEGRSP